MQVMCRKDSEEEDHYGAISCPDTVVIIFLGKEIKTIIKASHVVKAEFCLVCECDTVCNGQLCASVRCAVMRRLQGVFVGLSDESSSSRKLPV